VPYYLYYILKLLLLLLLFIRRGQLDQPGRKREEEGGPGGVDH